MGKEARCTARIGGVAAQGTAHLETDALTFRGPMHDRVPLAEIAQVVAADGVLTVCWRNEQLELDLGQRANAWAEAIRNPRTLADKLGIKPGMRPVLVGVTDVAFLADLARRGVAVDTALPDAGAAMILYGAEAAPDLGRIADLARCLAPNGALWVITPKRKAGVKDVDVMAAAKAAGLVDVKVVRFSEMHTGFKLVIPRAPRYPANPHITEATLITPKVESALNDQIQKEVFSSYLYLSMAAYCEHLKLPGAAHWMRLQHEEETMHARKLFEFVISREGRVTLQAIEQPPSDFGSILNVFEQALAHEKFITGSINDLYALAGDERDYATQVLLQWYINEQVEEEASATRIIDELKRAGDNPAVLLMIDRELGARTGAAPAAPADAT